MERVNKDGVWTDWVENYKCEGEFVLTFLVPLKVYGYDIGLDDSSIHVIGLAEVLLTDENWIDNKGEYSLMEHIHYTFNAEKNWGEHTPLEFLEDALLSTDYGNHNGAKGTVAYLNKLEIYKDYRGNHLFPIYLEAILDRCRKMKVDYAVLQPHPFGENLNYDEIQAGQQRLKQYYNRFGFYDFPTTRTVTYMLLDLKQHMNLLRIAQ